MNAPGDSKSVNILLIAGDAGYVRVLVGQLLETDSSQFRINHLASFDLALEHLQSHQCEADLVLLDLDLSNADGVTLLQRINEAAVDLPIVALAGQDDEGLALEAVKSGVQDFLVKEQLGPGLLARSLRYAIERHRRSLKSSLPVQQPNSEYDTVIGVPTRKLFRALLVQALKTADQTGHNFTLLLLSLDRLRAINSALGHQVGDQLLRAVSERLTALLSRRDTLARLGGSDFALILPDIHSHTQAAEFAKHIIARVSRPYPVQGSNLFTGVSIGMMVHKTRGEDETQLLRYADLALQQARKDIGGNSYQIYSPRLQEEASRTLELDRDLRNAIERKEFVLYFQPCVDIATGRVESLEALIRWQHPEWGIVPPGEFISLAEETGLIVEIDRWSLRNACSQNQAWQAAGGRPRCIAVNVSALHFGRMDFAKRVGDTLRETGLPPQLLEIELTETALVADPERAIYILQQLKAMGVRISVDDFGVGYSSLNYLRRLPVDTLKIDRSFVSELDNGEDKVAAVVNSIISLAKTLDLTIVAEGVETPYQLDWLRGRDCDRAQGFLFSQPVPEPDVETMDAAFRDRFTEVPPTRG